MEDATSPAVIPACPWVGLRPFKEGDRPFFFGRSDERQIILANLYGSRLTILYGPSAVGKSSLLQAGVVPDLRAMRSAVVYFRDWQQDSYLQSLKGACQAGVRAAAGRDLAIDPALPLDRWLDLALAQFDGPVFVLLDQFEEYLRYHAEGGATSFDAELARVINRRGDGVHVLLGLKEDAVATLDRFHGRIPQLLANTLRLGHLKADMGREAITGPVAVWNERKHSGTPRLVVDELLVSSLLSDVRPECLSGHRPVGPPPVSDASLIDTAILQLVLERLWRERVLDGDREVIRQKSYDDLGGAVAIARSHFDEAIGTLQQQNPRVPDLVIALFPHLVTPTRDKIAQKTEALVEIARSLPAEEVKNFLSGLADARLLRRLEHPEKYEVFHDCLASAFLDCARRFEAAAVRRAERARARKRLALGALGVAITAVVVWMTVALTSQRQRLQVAQAQFEKLRVANEQRQTQVDALAKQGDDDKLAILRQMDAAELVTDPAKRTQEDANIRRGIAKSAQASGYSALDLKTGLKELGQLTNAAIQQAANVTVTPPTLPVGSTGLPNSTNGLTPPPGTTVPPAGTVSQPPKPLASDAEVQSLLRQYTTAFEQPGSKRLTDMARLFKSGLPSRLEIDLRACSKPTVTVATESVVGAVVVFAQVFTCPGGQPLNSRQRWTLEAQSAGGIVIVKQELIR